MYKCKNCGYIHWLEELPERCPKCMKKTENFEEIDDKAENKIEESLYTNELLVELMDNLNQVLDISAEGMNERLDDDCYQLFTRIYKNSIEMIQAVKAEVANHVEDDKWG